MEIWILRYYSDNYSNNYQFNYKLYSFISIRAYFPVIVNPSFDHYYFYYRHWKFTFNVNTLFRTGPIFLNVLQISWNKHGISVSYRVPIIFYFNANAFRENVQTPLRVYGRFWKRTSISIIFFGSSWRCFKIGIVPGVLMSSTEQC